LYGADLGAFSTDNPEALLQYCVFEIRNERFLSRKRTLIFVIAQVSLVV